MKVNKIHLKNIGVFEDTTLTFPLSEQTKFADIHILTGVNGSGKSTVLYAIASAFDYLTKEHFNRNHVSNFFYKRFRFFENDDIDKAKSAVTIFFDKNKEPVEVYGCTRCKGIHSETKNQKIKTYRNFIVQPPTDTHTFDFAVFAYSGYRYIKSSVVQIPTNELQNPLYQSLEFVKNRNHPNPNALSIVQWIFNNYANQAILAHAHNIIESEKYRKNLTQFKQFITDIIGKSIDFVIKVNPTRLYLKVDEKELDFDVLPDGLRSLLSWVGDLMMIMDQVRWKDNTPLFERNFILLLDEIEVHLHPAWQRKILPVLQKFFINAQIFVTTHSPYIVNSIDGAYIYELAHANGNTIIAPPTISKTNDSISYVLNKVFGIKSEYGISVEKKLNKFYDLRNRVLNEQGKAIEQFIIAKNDLLELNDELINDTVYFETMQLYKQTKLDAIKQ